MVWINGGLMVVLGLLYLFVKPNVTERRHAKLMLLLGGTTVSFLLIYLGRSMHIALAVPFIALAVAVLIKTFLNWRELPAGKTGPDA